MHSKRPHQLRLGLEKEPIQDPLPKQVLRASLELLAKLLVDIIDSERPKGEGHESG